MVEKGISKILESPEFPIEGIDGFVITVGVRLADMEVMIRQGASGATCKGDCVILFPQQWQAVKDFVDAAAKQAESGDVWEPERPWEAKEC